MTSDDGTLKDIWEAELKKLGKWQNYRFGIVMVRFGLNFTTQQPTPNTQHQPPTQPAAQRNLAVVLLQERVDLALAKEIFAFLARALGHLHGNGIIHGDFKVIDRSTPSTPP